VAGADPEGGDWGDHPPKTYESNFIHPGPALPLGELGGCLGRWVKGGAKIRLCGSKSDVHQKRE